jgi:hypothetical protein
MFEARTTAKFDQLERALDVQTVAIILLASGVLLIGTAGLIYLARQEGSLNA